MLIELLAAAGGEAAPQNQFGFMEAMEQGGFIAWSILTVLVIMSVGSFYILFTKLLEQNKILQPVQGHPRPRFWRANTLREGAAKLDKNSAWRQLVDDGLAAEDQHAQDDRQRSKRTTGCTARSRVRKPRSTPGSPAACRSSPPSARPRRSSACSARLSASTAR